MEPSDLLDNRFKAVEQQIMLDGYLKYYKCDILCMYLHIQGVPKMAQSFAAPHYCNHTST